jgi:hypothetical protein
MSLGIKLVANQKKTPYSSSENKKEDLFYCAQRRRKVLSWISFAPRNGLSHFRLMTGI